MKTNYRQAIRNRCPRTVDLALKWCKAKDNWVEYIYETYFSFLKDNKSKNDQLDGIFKQFDFAKNIEWKTLDKPELYYWSQVTDWIEWFTKTLLPISETYKDLCAKELDAQYIEVLITKRYLLSIDEKNQKRLYKLLINHIQQHYV